MTALKLNKANDINTLTHKCCNSTTTAITFISQLDHVIQENINRIDEKEVIKVDDLRVKRRKKDANEDCTHIYHDNQCK